MAHAESWSAILANDRRTELVGRGLALDTVAINQPDAPWPDLGPGLRGRLYLGHMTDVIDPAVASITVRGEPVTPRVVERRWTPAAQATVYRAADAVLHEQRFVVGDAFVCEVRVDGDARVAFTGPLTVAGLRQVACLTDMRPSLAPTTVYTETHAGEGRLVVGLGASAGAAHAAADRAARATAQDAQRAFDLSMDAFAPVLLTDDVALSRLYAYRCFLAWRALQRPDRWFAGHPMPGELIFEGPSDAWFSQPIGLPLPLQIRELRWLRAPAAVAGTLAAWTSGTGALRAFAGDPVSAAMDHRESEIGAGVPALRKPGEDDPPAVRRLGAVHRADVDTFHLTMLRASLDALRRHGEPDAAGEAHLAALHERFADLHGGPDGIFRSARPDGSLVESVVGFDGVLPFAAGDFSPAHRAGLLDALSPAHLGGAAGLRSTSITSPGYCPDNRWTAGPAAPYDYPCSWNGPVWNYGSSWALLSLGRVARSTGDPRLTKRFGELWDQWSASHFTAVDGGVPLAVEHLHPDCGRAFRVVADYFHSAWLAPFLEHVVGVGHPSGRTAFAISDLTVHDVPWEGGAVRVDVEDGAVRTR